MLIDSNIIIYGAKAENEALRQWIAANAPAVSVVSQVEVLGYHKLTNEEKKHFEEFFAAATVLAITDRVVEQAIRLRQSRKMSLGDSLVAGAALTAKRALATVNTKDFNWIDGLTVLNPFDVISNR